MITIVQFVALVLTALSMSVYFGTWITERPMRRTQSGAVFIESQQGRDLVAARVMPALGNAAIVFVGIGVFFARISSAAFAILLAGLIFIIGDMVVTLTCNVPINREVQSWQADSPPAEWKQVRDRWEMFHSIRTLLIVLGFNLFAASVVFFEL